MSSTAVRLRAQCAGPNRTASSATGTPTAPSYQKKVGIPSERKVRRQLTLKLGRPPTVAEVRTERKVNHLTPKAAGGCPTGDTSKLESGNLQAHGQLCPACRDIDTAFNAFQ